MVALTRPQAELLVSARRATLATLAPEGAPLLVPVCFAVRISAADAVIYSPIDEKPKRGTDPRSLARVRHLLARPDVALLVDRWSEDWSELAWLRLEGLASLLEPARDRQREPARDAGPEADEHAQAVDLLRDRYPQYRTHALETLPIIRIRVVRAVGWEASRR